MLLINNWLEVIMPTLPLESEIIRLSKNAIGFRISCEMTDAETGREEKKYSPCIYFGKEYDVAEVAELFPDHEYLLSSIRAEKVTKVVHTCSGKWMPLKYGDIVIPMEVPE